MKGNLRNANSVTLWNTLRNVENPILLLIRCQLRYEMIVKDFDTLFLPERQPIEGD